MQYNTYKKEKRRGGGKIGEERGEGRRREWSRVRREKSKERNKAIGGEEKGRVKRKEREEH
jgi:hypothetical protein